MPDRAQSAISTSGSDNPRAFRLDHLLGPALASEPWTNAELGDIFRHQLDASLAFDLSCGNPMEFNAIWLEASAATPAPRTFGELFRHPEPPIALLIRVKDFAKRASSDPNATVPPEIAAFLYHGVVAAALVHHRQRITSRSNAALLAGFGSLLERDWLDAPCRLLMEAAAELVRGKP